MSDMLPPSPFTSAGNASVARHALAVVCGGHPLVLCAEHAAFDPAAGTLFVADPHFGKAETFRAHGIPVPAGLTGANLARLDALIMRHAPRAIVFLGDFLHAAPAQSDRVMDALQRWRDRHPDLAITLVRGNHDRHAGPTPARLRIAEVEEPWRLGPWTLCHHPQRIAGQIVMAGHLHPVFRLRAAHDRARLPCFVIAEEEIILPAFGAFTGGADVTPGDARLYVIADDLVAAVGRKPV